MRKNQVILGCHTLTHGTIGWIRISISWKMISAITFWMSLGVCDEILMNLNPFGVYPTALIAHEKFQDPYISPKKILPIMGFMVLKMTGLSSQFQCKNRFWKIYNESKIQVAKPNLHIFRRFGKYLWTQYIFFNKNLRWNHQLKLSDKAVDQGTKLTK